MSESDEVREIVRWFRLQYPEYALCLRVSQSEGKKGGGTSAAIAWSKRVAMGVVKGESDIAILLPRNGWGCLIIEHKAEGGTHKATMEQTAYITHHNHIGNCAVLTRGIDAAKAAIKAYINE